MPRPPLRFLFAAVWILVTLYPNPMLLTRSISHALNPPIDPAAVRVWAEQLPEDPAYIERQVRERYVPYSVPWQTHGVPWHYPTTSSVVAQGTGDCQARMLVLASILEAKGIPYQIRASLDHIWVEYTEKQPNVLENRAIAVMQDGKLDLPQQWDWWESYRIEKEYFWDPMPLGRKLLLFGGLGLILFWHRTARVLRWARIQSYGENAQPGERSL
jgi:hypothetical protein